MKNDIGKIKDEKPKKELLTELNDVENELEEKLKKSNVDKAKLKKKSKKDIAQAKGDYVDPVTYNKIKPFQDSEGDERLDWKKKLPEVKSFPGKINEEKPVMVCGNTDQPCTPGVLFSEDLRIISKKIKDEYYKKLIKNIKEGKKLPKKLQDLMSLGDGKERTYLDFILQMKGPKGKIMKEIYDSPKKNKNKKPKDIGTDDKTRRKVLKEIIVLLLKKMKILYGKKGGKEDENNIFYKTTLKTGEMAKKVTEIEKNLGFKNKSMSKEDHEYSTDEEF